MFRHHHRVCAHILAAGMIACFASSCMMVNLKSLTTKPELVETVVEKDPHWLTDGKVLLVDIGGLITEERGGGLFSLSGVCCTPDYVKSVLNRARQDSRIRAVILRIDSPGGTVGASELIAREVRLFRTETNIPVYAQITGLGCSGGYYVAAAADRIHIQKSSITGSIGVIASLPNFRKLADKIGYEQTVVKSGVMKDIGSALRAMTPEEGAVFQALIDSSYHQFLMWIVENRPQLESIEHLKPIADGRIYTADQALAHRLVDRVAFLDETISAVKQAAHLTRADVIVYGYDEPGDPNIYTRASAAASGLRLFNAELPLPAARPGLYYLWSAGL